MQRNRKLRDIAAELVEATRSTSGGGSAWLHRHAHTNGNKGGTTQPNGLAQERSLA